MQRRKKNNRDSVFSHGGVMTPVSSQKQVLFRLIYLTKSAEDVTSPGIKFLIY